MTPRSPSSGLADAGASAEEVPGGARPQARRDSAWSYPTESAAPVSVRVLLSAGTLVLFLFVALAGAAGWDGGFAVGVTLCFLVGFGVAPALAMRSADVALLVVVAIGISLSVAVLTGMVMAGTGSWHPMAAFSVWACLSSGGLIVHLRRDLPVLRADSRVPPAPRLPVWRRMSWVMSGSGLLLITLDANIHRRPAPPGGLLTIVGPAWWIGLLLLVAAPVLATLRRENPGPAILGLSVPIVLSQAVAYGAPTAMPGARHIGVVEYILAFHRLLRDADIYHAWSGLFSGTAWLSDVAGIRDPLTTVATFWPVPLNLAIVLAMRVLAGQFGASRTRAWWAGGIFILANTLNVTYFSPQSLGFLFSLVILALAVRTSRLRGAELATTAVLIVTLSCALAVSHQISPYLLGAALLVLTAFRVVRPGWPVAAVLVPAVAWALINLDQVKRFVSAQAFGDVLTNIQPPSSPLTDTSESVTARLVFGLPALVLVVVGVVALLSLWQNRDRRAWALMVTSAASLVLALGSNYGHEAIFRITLFALPWLCICAVLVSVPPRAFAPVLVGGLAVLCAVNAFGLTGMDWARTIRTDEASQLAAVERQALPGSRIYAVGGFAATPGRSTEHYFDVTYDAILFDPGSLVHANPGSQVEANREVAALAVDMSQKCEAECFVVTSESARGYNDRYGVQRAQQADLLFRAFASTPGWVPYSSGPTAHVYRLAGANG